MSSITANDPKPFEIARRCPWERPLAHPSDPIENYNVVFTVASHRLLLRASRIKPATPAKVRFMVRRVRPVGRQFLGRAPQLSGVEEGIRPSLSN